jgi:hypothetical protein
MADCLATQEVRPPTVRPTSQQERPYLLLEDLLDDPFEWTLCDVHACATAAAPAKAAAAPIH